MPTGFETTPPSSTLDDGECAKRRIKGGRTSTIENPQKRHLSTSFTLPPIHGSLVGSSDPFDPSISWDGDRPGDSDSVGRDWGSLVVRMLKARRFVALQVFSVRALRATLYLRPLERCWKGLLSSRFKPPRGIHRRGPIFDRPEDSMRACD